ncbi:integrin alpha-3 [Myxocyprinus asiaticus]|uniref:integrin alpha-3 n=1 Tax=Myxocyprinus asiaticus TaxID=70543 RepID=UPI00222201C1|nr:integrin alpha-3 [Myxocyprinus asiaticus]XP_051571368.1 integrin alpha-3 [Myxocyprinus asiaticus]XP_051571369.1 integrin alpha-3 [Myxocyprinus asiaticus]XP_051571370.1 integrin alpha-3 [Myxocyprinus asiaticus]XP_051571371.1 integrin alpha-3 [Myxocyprinus asiaticus]
MNVFHRHGHNKNMFVLVLMLFAPHCCHAFNLDVRFPVVKEGKTAGSLFGLSVALHEQVVGEKRYLLLVGAPKEKAGSGLPATETGDVYACPITADPKDCKRLNLLKSNPEDIPEPKMDVIEGMWLGVSVASQSQPGGRILACGHRYVRNMTANLRMIGKCYIRGNNLMYNEDDPGWQAYNELCNPIGSKDDEGLCLAGMSSAITQTVVISGTPGCYNWQGNAFLNWHNPNDPGYELKIKFPDMNRGNIYIGYSVAMDQGVLSKEKDTVVTGAPRDGAKGSVMMAESLKNSNMEEKLILKATVMGKQVGSYFGNSIALVDLNNDGWKDLIVGAPFFFDRKTEKGGAVYIYMNQNGSFHDNDDVILTGPKDSAFGMAVVAVGDINQDGFQDFAIGAPYHESGRVYIWIGNKDGHFHHASQIIDGKDFPAAGFQTFGYSISGGMDVDGNSYPDIVVGSLDDRVVLLRARPVVHLKKTFTVTPEVIDPNDCDSCIEAKVCFSYKPGTGSTSSTGRITLQYTVEADRFHRSPRVRFLDNKEGKFSDKMSINPSGECRALKLELVPKAIQDKVAPIVFSLNVSLEEPPPSAKQSVEDLSAFPIIGQGDALTVRKEIHIQKACGPDNKCESNLQMTALFTDEQNRPLPTQDGSQIFHYTTDLKKLRLMVNVSNIPSKDRIAEDAYSAFLNVTIPTSLSFSSLNPKNLTPEFPDGPFFLQCTLGDPFKSNQRMEIEITFETSGITIDMQEIQIELQLSTRSDQNDLRPLTRVLVVEYILKPHFLVLPSQFKTECSGKIMGESAMKSISDIGSPVEFNITVTVPGKPLGNLGFLEVVFQWPYSVSNGKWLLYLSEILMTGNSKSFCVPEKNIINPLNLTVSEHKSGRRRKRRNEASVESKHPKPQVSLNSRDVRKTVKLDCTTGTAHCQTFTCPLLDMGTSTTLIVKARLWNSTILEDYTGAEIIVYGNAILSLKTDKPTIKMISDTREFSVLIESAGTENGPYEAPLWIIIVSVLAGVILLGLIVILLWKCGFFKRANTRELYEAKAQKAEMKTQPSEKDRLTEDD